MCIICYYIQKKAEPVMRFELMTSSLPRKRSTPELHWRSLSGRRGSNPRPLAWKANALPTELLPLFSFLLKDPWVGLFQIWWEKMDSNHRRYKPADLQSAPFGHSGILPFFKELEPMEGIEPTTPRLQITCSSQLSYIGDVFNRSFPKRDCKDRY